MVQKYLDKLRSKPSPWGKEETKPDAQEGEENAMHNSWTRHQERMRELEESPYPVFRKYGGRMTSEDFNRHIDKSILRKVQKEYVKEIMGKFDKPYEHRPDRRITEQEFQQGLREMVKDFQGPIKREDVETLKKHFGRPSGG